MNSSDHVVGAVLFLTFKRDRVTIIAVFAICKKADNMSSFLMLMGVITFFVGLFGSLSNPSTPFELPYLSPIMSFFLGILAATLLSGSIYTVNLERPNKQHHKESTVEDG
ncbi:MAG: hypothetical protein A2655_01040 [Candidatus Yanofskybacteria bacterium RIFCSPHIGHO2_01_FULL_43_42]|uniref:Uncharacterized protein n=1 Tax=Candidatus Yanofskybacteria bacterium RIFCSPLOWO2_01_FULL_43_22 TaxID=1802695 RepID=A0A1F8GEF7_9BACT|nr:MAG: hypothetical protein A2655_01040 [Candidatus Yanofskybacteria bacterium RIFCSPHIGHO2_01_FULL_43_42]OGN12395.1 MAG: hypothetical protein A3D48_01770 [Candidatus Yanofskybacteria bacterium RIFCSPHIGHO2_02_FULL_43_17]OGN23767.1 MAG: hypothetical protein A3A13_01830 [Candidatus Yanofskybacteria bacterium RIFCSPLOWO2_01_FULL_43_22]